MPEKTSPKYLPIHIANYLLWLAERDGVQDMTPMKLLKLVYFAYAWYLTIANEELFAEKVEAWKFGPVIPSLYHEFKRFGSQPITDYAQYYDDIESDEPDYPTIDGEDENIWSTVAAVWRHYKGASGAQLSHITHEPGSPWTEVYVSGRHMPMRKEKMRTRARQAMDDFWRVHGDGGAAP